MSKYPATGVIDYGGGNIRSLVKALESLGAAPSMITAPEQLDGIELLFFPGQGAFGDCMERLKGRALVAPLVRWIRADRPFFGICVGYQLLFERSEEQPGVEGLSIFEGAVKRLPEGEGLKVPHMGWNAAELQHPNRCPWQGLGAAPYFYFVHSYFPSPADEDLVAAVAEHGTRFPCAIQRGNLVATQFHPEKSQKTGMKLIGNFLESSLQVALD